MSLYETSGHSSAGCSFAGSSLARHFWRQVSERPESRALCVVDDSAAAASFDADSFDDSARGPGLCWLTWGQLAQRVTQVANWIVEDCSSVREKLSAARGKQTDPPVIATQLANSETWVAIELACQSLGVVHAAIDARETSARGSEMSRRAGASRLITDAQAVKALPGRLPFSTEDLQQRALAMDPKQDGSILFTSGSTGSPAGVILSHVAVEQNARAKLDAAPQHSTDVRINVLPFSHAYARTCELATWVITGGGLALCPAWKQFSVFCKQLNPTLVNLVPLLADRVAALLDEQPTALGNRMRLLQVGGAALSEELWQRLADHGLPPIQGYGMSEAGPVVCSGRDGSQRQGDVGFPVQGVEIRLTTGGELIVRSPSLLSGRIGDDGPATMSDGWLPTGDLATIAPNGRVRIVGRKNRRLTLSNGLNVDPQEIENFIEQSANVVHCVIGLQVEGVDKPRVSTLTAYLWPRGEFSRQDWDAIVEGLRTSASEDASESGFPGYAIPQQYQISPFELTEDFFTAKGTLRKLAVLQRIAK